MKNGIIAAVVALLVVSSIVAVPLLPAFGVVSIIKNTIDISESRIQIKDRKEGSYTADIENVRGVIDSDISEEQAAENKKATNYNELLEGSTPIYSVNAKNENLLNVILIAYDPDNILSREIQDDVSVLFSLNLNAGSLKSYLINNNIYLPVEGYGWNRLGDAIEFGGLGLYINTINDVFQLDIQNYIMIDVTLLPQLIDMIGGVSVELDSEAAAKGGLSEGTHNVNGETLYNLLKNRVVETGYAVERIGDKFGEFSKNTDIMQLISSFMFMFKTNITFSKLVKTIVKVVSTVKDGAEDFNASFKDLVESFHYAIADPEGYDGKVSVILIDDFKEEIIKIQKEIYEN